MRCSAIIISALAASVYAVPLATTTTTTDIEAREPAGVALEAVEDQSVHELSERAVPAIAVAVLSTAGTAAISTAVTAAVNSAGNLIKALTDWTKAREQFTQDTASAMASKMPSGYVAAVLANTGYKISGSGTATPATKVRISKSALHTDYDCIYLAKGNVFTLTGDGGYINWAWKGSCKYDAGKKTLTC